MRRRDKIKPGFRSGYSHSNRDIRADDLYNLRGINYPIMKRKIAVVTTSRADYSHLYWPLRDLSAHPDVDLKIIGLGRTFRLSSALPFKKSSVTVLKSPSGWNACLAPIPM